MPSMVASVFRILLVPALVLTAALPSALAARDRPVDEESAHWSQYLRSYLQRVNEVDWRLSQAALPLCQQRIAGHGAVFDTLSAYDEDDRDGVSHALGLGNEPQVAATAQGSPASIANILPGDDLLAVNGARLDEIHGKELASISGDETSASLALLPTLQASTLTIRRGDAERIVEVTPVERCAIGTVLTVEERVDAYSDRHNVAITTGLLGFVRNEDELALIIGHELAHVLLRDRHESMRTRAKRKEDEADALGAQLAHCAGYDLRKAIGLWDRFDKTRAMAWLPSLTHRSSGQRQRQLAELVTTLTCDRIGSVLDGV